MNLDLNLFRTFDALMNYRSVTRAARHLGVTQPAVSHALARLRIALDDPLFIRSPGGLRPTARAEEIAGGVRRGLSELRDALAPTSFDPRTTDRHFTLATTSYFNALLVPTLIEQVRQEAPGLGLRLVASGEMLVPLLDHGTIDLALGASIEAPGRIVLEPLYREQLVWIAAPDNPAGNDPQSMIGISQYSQIVIVPGQPFDLTDTNVLNADHSADPLPTGVATPGSSPITVYDSHTAIALVERTDLIARVPEWMARRAADEGRVVMLRGVTDGPSYQMAMLWHARRRTDPGLAWLRDRIRALTDQRSSGFARDRNPSPA
jgi:DNA-binding transcriptional LysR family regulator